MKRGKFITFEGLDGAGKSTQAALLASWLRSYCKLNVLETFEPGGAPMSDALRKLVMKDETLDGIAQTLLFAAARREHIRHRIAPALADGVWVVCDRFSDSTFAYQGGGRGVDVNWIDAVLRGVHEDLQPDITFYLDAPIDKQKRAATDDDVFENSHDDFYAAVDAEYRRQIEKSDGRIKIIDWYHQDERRNKLDIAEEIRGYTKALL